ncbi:hypothetical protein Tco_0435374 [Tanacetum coccineum]
MPSHVALKNTHRGIHPSLSISGHVISAGFQAGKISKFCLSKEHSSLRPFSINVDPMVTVYSGYSGWIAIFIFSSSTWFTAGGWMLGPEIIAHSVGMTLLLYNVTVPPSTGNFNILCAVDGTARIFLIPGLPMIALCWDGDLITMKFIYAEVECTSSPTFTSKAIWPSGQMQCSYKTSEDAPPSMYTLCTKCPPISTSMIIGPSVPSSSLRGGKDIVVSGEKLWDPSPQETKMRIRGVTRGFSFTYMSRLGKSLLNTLGVCGDGDSGMPSSCLLLASVRAVGCLGLVVVQFLHGFLILIPDLRNRSSLLSLAFEFAISVFFFLHLFQQCAKELVINFVALFPKTLSGIVTSMKSWGHFLPPCFLTADVGLFVDLLFVSAHGEFFRESWLLRKRSNTGWRHLV